MALHQTIGSFDVIRIFTRHGYLLVLFCFGVLGTAMADFSVIEDRGDYVRVRLKAPEPQIRNSDQYAIVSAGAWPLLSGSDHYRLPFFSTTLHLESDRVVASAKSLKSYTIKISPPHIANDQVIAPDSLRPFLTPDQPQTPLPDSLVLTRYLGKYRGNHLWSLRFFPYQYDPGSGQLTVYSEIEVEFRLDPPAGPTVATPVPEEEFINSLTSLSHKKKAKPSGAAPLRKPAASFERWKIYVIEEGFYRISGQELVDAGVNLLDIDIKNLRLTANGADVPLYVYGWQDGQFNRGDYFEFWGEDYKKTFLSQAADLYRDPYTSTNVYWLSWERQGRWMTLEEGQVSEQDRNRTIRPYSFYETVHVEQDGYYDRLSSVPIDSLRDFWFYDGGIRPGRKQEYTFELYHPDDQSSLPVLPQVMLSGRSMIDSVQHNVSAFLNDSYIGTGTWQRQDYFSLTATSQNQIFASDLVHGPNRMTIVNNTPADQYDIFMLNWFEVTYPRLYRAEKNFIKFKIPPNYSSGTFLFKVDGFTGKDIDVFKLGYSKITGTTIDEVTDIDDVSSVQVSFQDVVTSNQIEYIALTPEARKKPFRIERAGQEDFRSLDIRADYLLLVHPRFFDNPVLDQLLDLRQSQGLQTLKVNVRDVYDEFDFGHESPFAVKNFIKFAYEQWGTKFVLFIGDGSFYRNNALRDTLDFIPVYMRQTAKFGSAASDHWYSLVDGEDEIPDVHIGRLPVGDNDQLTIAAGKIIANETSPAPGNWKNRILFIGGNGSVFRDQAFRLQEHVPPKVESRFLFTTKKSGQDYDPYFGGNADLIDYFAEGCAVITFHGHGGGAIWADNGLLRLEDSQRLYNQNKLPLVLSMTCFTGSFESPGRFTLADALLFDNEYGAMAVLGASGVGWLWNDYYLETEILKSLFKRPSATIGEIIDGGKISYYSMFKGYLAISEINQYHLLGDPAARLVMPQQELSFELSDETLKPGDPVVLSGSLPFDSGQLNINIIDNERAVISSYQRPGTSRIVREELIVPPEISTPSGYLQLYAEDALGVANAHGSVPFSLTGVLFDSSAVIDAGGDSLLFKIKLENDLPVSEVSCLVLGDTLGMKQLEEGWYLSLVGKKIIWYGNEIPYQFVATTETGTIVTSPVYRYREPGQVDLQMVPNSLSLGGEEQVQLQARIYNATDLAAENVTVIFEEIMPDSNFSLIGRDSVNVPPFQFAEALIPYSALPGKKRFRVRLDYSNDPFYYNNQLIDSLYVSRFNFAPGRGLLVNNSVLDTLVYGQLKISSHPQLAPLPMVISVAEQQRAVIYEQPDVHWIEGSPVYQLSFGNSGTPLSSPLGLVLQLPPEAESKYDSLGKKIALFQFDNRLKKWRRLATEAISAGYVASVNAAGSVSFFTWEDDSPPSYEFSIDGQPYVEGRIVGRQPVISLLFQDANGVDLSSENFSLSLDGKKMDKNEIGLADSLLNANQVGLKITPSLETGGHSFVFQVTDYCTNVSDEVELVVNVQASFEINMLGNYPNPFLEETIFAYELTQPCEELSLKIYTASGRLIRNMNAFEFSQDPNPLSADYHELVWDGTDQEGNEVANGVYFYKLIAKQKEQTKEVMGKVAKIK